MPKSWTKKVTKSAYKEILRKKIAAGTATEDEKRAFAGKLPKTWALSDSKKLDKLYNRLFPMKECEGCGKKIKRFYRNTLCSACYKEYKKIMEEEK